MSVRVLYDKQRGCAALYDSTTETTLACPLFLSGATSADNDADDFLTWVHVPWGEGDFCPEYGDLAGTAADWRTRPDVRLLTARGLRRAREEWARQFYLPNDPRHPGRA